eukprot:TRINITY_DN42880_c0_g1_i1.p1 TRINITY_DN42880_c0_g1~~TRINITY_DN42880_c0_g1_i1.p1  ORF type:complete len:417 (+),score=136.11 TRINITY_DN42880_c0_g1_i1:51-1253(+)
MRRAAAVWARRAGARWSSGDAKLDAKVFYDALTDNKISKFYGVPDSLLKDVCAYITDAAGDSNICTANEGSAVAMAAGYHIATGNAACVYLQNSGIGNTVNPLLSLTHEKVYKIPMLLLVGWRGEPGVKDEPQHVAQGALMEPLLKSIELPFAVLPSDEDGARREIAKAAEHFREHGTPYCLMVRKGTFQGYKLKSKVETSFEMSREDAIKIMLDTLGDRDCVVSTTGMPSREVFEHRAATIKRHERDFLTVGCMGHASQIAVGIALEKPDRQVYVVDGDGAAIMHMGGMATIGGVAKQRESALRNLKHVLINNGAHDSVGGQPTVGFDVDLPGVAGACGYTVIGSVDTAAALREGMKALAATDGPAILEIKVNKGARSDLGRPTTTPQQNKGALMSFLQ